MASVLCRHAERADQLSAWRGGDHEAGSEKPPRSRAQLPTPSRIAQRPASPLVPIPIHNTPDVRLDIGLRAVAGESCGSLASGNVPGPSPVTSRAASFPLHKAAVWSALMSKPKTERCLPSPTEREASIAEADESDGLYRNRYSPFDFEIFRMPRWRSARKTAPTKTPIKLAMKS